MIERLFILSLILPVFIGCAEKVSDKGRVTTISVKTDGKDAPAEINKFLKFSHFVPLETTDDCMIGTINKLQIIHDRIYVMDRKQRAVFAFDKNGKALFSIQKRGRAGNEYIEMSDFEVGPDGSVFIYDELAGKINAYDESGRLTRQIENVPKGWSLKLLDGNRIAYNLGNGIGDGSAEDNNFNYVCTEGSVVTQRAIPYNKAVIGHKILWDNYISSFSQYGEKIFMSSFLNDTIYEVSASSGAITPYAAFDFPREKLAADDPENRAAAYLESMIRGEIPSTPFCFYGFLDGMMAFYDYENRPYILIASSGGEILYSGSPGYDENGISAAYFTPYLDSDHSGYVLNVATPGNIASSIDYHKTKKNREMPLLNEINARVRENDNPILLFYKWIY